MSDRTDHATQGPYDAQNMGLARPDGSLYTSTLGTHTLLPDGSIAFVPSTNLRIGDCVRALLAADNSATYICRVRSPGGLTGISGPTIRDTDGKIWCFFVYPSDGTVSYETDTAGVLAYATTGASNLSVGDDLFWKFVVASGAALSTARNVGVYVSSNPIVWPANPCATVSIKVQKIGIGAVGSTGWHGVPLLLGESLV